MSSDKPSVTTDSIFMPADIQSAFNVTPAWRIELRMQNQASRVTPKGRRAGIWCSGSSLGVWRLNGLAALRSIAVNCHTIV